MALKLNTFWDLWLAPSLSIPTPLLNQNLQQFATACSLLWEQCVQSNILFLTRCQVLHPHQSPLPLIRCHYYQALSATALCLLQNGRAQIKSRQARTVQRRTSRGQDCMQRLLARGCACARGTRGTGRAMQQCAHRHTHLEHPFHLLGFQHQVHSSPCLSQPLSNRGALAAERLAQHHNKVLHLHRRLHLTILHDMIYTLIPNRFLGTWARALMQVRARNHMCPCVDAASSAGYILYTSL